MGHKLALFFKEIHKNRVIRGSFFMGTAALIVGIGNYVFNVLMGRMLGPIDYGVLASLLSLVFIINVPSQTLGTITTRYIARFESRKELGHARFFFNYLLKKTLIISLFVSLLFLAASPFLKIFLKVEAFSPFLILLVILFFSLLSALPMGGLRGLEKFFEISLYNVITTILKVILGVALVWLGFKINGALFALFFSGLLLALLFYKDLKLPAQEAVELKDEKIFHYAIPVFFVSLCLATLYNLDVIMAKHFLSDTQAGYYAVLSLMGKIILFGTASIGDVLFPIVAKNHQKGADSGGVLRLSLIITFCASCAVTLIYFAFPESIISKGGIFHNIRRFVRLRK